MSEYGRIIDVADISGLGHGYYLDTTSESAILAEFETISLWNRVVNESCKKPR